jgi:hypothetical protein
MNSRRRMPYAFKISSTTPHHRCKVFIFLPARLDGSRVALHQQITIICLRKWE